MIFVTVGTQAPFDRLIEAIDQIALLTGEIPVVAQVSDGIYRAKNMKTMKFMSPNEFDANFRQAKLIVSHAGMGTIISAFVQNKPILIMPRLAKFREHRNDHQLATAKMFEKLKYVHVAYNETELQQKLLALLNTDLEPLYLVGKYASYKLIQSLKTEIDLIK